MSNSIAKFEAQPIVRQGEVLSGLFLAGFGIKTLLDARTQSVASAALEQRIAEGSDSRANHPEKVSTRRLAIAGAVEVAVGAALLWAGLRGK